MENLVFRLFGVLFKFIGVLLVGGTIVAVLTDIQKKAFDSRRIALTSMLKINQQLVGKTR
jgi:hypothetical protein